MNGLTDADNQIRPSHVGGFLSHQSVSIYFCKVSMFACLGGLSALLSVCIYNNNKIYIVGKYE